MSREDEEDRNGIPLLQQLGCAYCNCTGYWGLSCIITSCGLLKLLRASRTLSQVMLLRTRNTVYVDCMNNAFTDQFVHECIQLY